MVENPYKAPESNASSIEPRRRQSCAPFLAVAAVLALGALLLIGSLTYHVVVLGIPPQDPSPEDMASRNFHHVVAGVMAASGICVLLTGTAALVVVVVKASLARQNAEAIS